MHNQVKIFHVYRDHPILDRVAQHFASGPNSEFLQIWKDHFSFIYPCSLVFSFVIHSGGDGLFDQDSLNNQNVEPLSPGLDSSRNGTVHTREFESSEDVKMYLDFYQQLGTFLSSTSLNPLVIFDLRPQRYLDVSLVLSALQILRPHVREALMLMTEDAKSVLMQDVPENEKGRCLSEKELVRHLRGLLDSGETKISIAGTPVITLESIEQQFAKLDTTDLVVESLIVTLDLRDRNKISFFSAQELLALMFTLSHEFGVLWRIQANKESLKKTFIAGRFVEAAKPIMDPFEEAFDLPDWPGMLADIQDRCGTYVFDQSASSKLFDVIDTFLADLLRRYSRISEYVSRVHDPLHESHKPSIHRKTRHSSIRSIISELIENVILHSRGVGYFSAYIRSNILQVYVGDSGVGLREGILNNYDISEIKSDRDALAWLFELYKRQDCRRESDVLTKYAGFGLRDMLQNIFACNGKFLCKSGRQIASFVNPVTKVSSPSKILDSKVPLRGTHYMIMIPLAGLAKADSFPAGTDDFLEFGV
jgi:hypothetical protein